MKAIETMGVFDSNGKLNIEELPEIKNKKVRVLILVDENDNEAELYTLSQQCLSKAYSNEEPDYDASLIKEPNAAYAGR